PSRYVVPTGRAASRYQAASPSHPGPSRNVNLGILHLWPAITTATHPSTRLPDVPSTVARVHRTRPWQHHSPAPLQAPLFLSSLLLASHVFSQPLDARAARARHGGGSFTSRRRPSSRGRRAHQARIRARARDRPLPLQEAQDRL